MKGLTPEQEVIELGRAIVELADAFKRGPIFEEQEGPGVTFARELTQMADAGFRGLTRDEIEARKPAPVNTRSDWPKPPPPESSLSRRKPRRRLT